MEERRSKMRKAALFGVVFGIFILALSNLSFAQCKGDFDCDGVVDGSDLADFAEDYGRMDCPDCIAAPVAKTGQTISYTPGDDGALEMGVQWPIPRFADNADGTVTDNLTGLIWLKNAGCTHFFSGDDAGQNARTWADALTAANSLSSSYCGLSDGSISGDWRLPNIRELHSLIHYGIYSPAVPNTAGTGKWTPGDPFTNLQVAPYYSSTTRAEDTSRAWSVLLHDGNVGNSDKTDVLYVWCVRGGP
jgi:hypothetical protein